MPEIENIKIQGLQKLTLLDYPGKIACTIFTAPCNLRCPFCHNTSLIFGTNPEISWSEVRDFLTKRIGILEGVCITGGEPTLHKSLETMLIEIKKLGYVIKLDTNGSRPDQLKHLVNSGLLDYVALDIKNSPTKYGQTVGVANYDLKPIQASIEFLLTGVVDYEFRTTVVRDFHDRESLLELAHFIKGAKQYYLQSFVPGEEVLQPGLQAYSVAELNSFVEDLKPILPQVQLRGV